jgi:hypothetical protein
MATTRNRVELAALKSEAERRVRTGQSRAYVAQVLNIQPSTLSNWALMGRWREKDLSAERAEDTVRRIAEQIAALRAREAEDARIRAEKRDCARQRRDSLNGPRPSPVALEEKEETTAVAAASTRSKPEEELEEETAAVAAECVAKVAD